MFGICRFYPYFTTPSQGKPQETMNLFISHGNKRKEREGKERERKGVKNYCHLGEGKSAIELLFWDTFSLVHDVLCPSLV